ncbi:integral membrane protein GPR137 [Latimeria chalumnae]|uniref:G protein-coupled receptor 137 n=1 Tax=Latimeria chalumnae TaxID=7897 RepID=H3BES3_LATCH|nr:PREDICTED: integral membrane protein GPR137 [Latimeria chalumnae]XP_014339412.1 PREDICTED: integral membrane protein GPR137 [Latimeria chalumnae]XP_014339417.1 PREDICTED: integral membrane protein GPR137 [Latimeria chalumnae]|eukprot:XP_005988934.1 PREDICTED: integral membrane protein GPR137 [Latimeria chalumnae]
MQELSPTNDKAVMVTPGPLKPAVPPSVRLGLTILYTSLYALLFLFIYFQLWLVLYYRHKKLSYQTVFLSLCLFWAALRTTLFSFYFQDTVKANHLDPFSFWLLYCFPVCLQFFTLSLMNLYFVQVVFKAKAKAKFYPELTKGLMVVRIVVLSVNLLFLAVNFACALLVKLREETWGIVLVRVLINDCLFVLCAVSLAVCLYMLAKMSPSTNIYLESKGTSVCQTMIVGVVIILIYTTRACYNLVVLALTPATTMDTFDYDWYNVSDQADLMKHLGDKGYLVFGAILFVWELLPTGLLVFFFRVRRPPQDLAGSGVVNSQSFGTKSYFFDNPRQFENTGTAWLSSTTGEQNSLSDSLQATGWYGAIGRNSMDQGWFGHNHTAPLLFARDNVQSNHHHSLYSTPQM